MAAGVPAIISDFPVFIDYVERASCGFTLDPFDSEAVAARMSQLELDRELAQKLGESGRNFVETEHNWEVYSRRLLTMYDELATEVVQSNGRSRSEEHTSELQSLMRISYAVFCLKKK